MTEQISRRIISYLKKKGIIIHDEDVHLYGCDAIIYTIVSTIGLLTIGFLCHRAIHGCVFIAIFYLNQSIGGGFHANSHWKCFSVMSIAMLISFGMMEITEMHPCLSYIAIPSLFVLFLIPLVLHPNLQHLQSKSEAIIRKSRIATAFQAATLIILSLLKIVTPFIALSVSITLSAISRIIGYHLYR